MGKDIMITPMTEAIGRRAAARAVSTLGPLVPPYVIGGALVGGSALLHTHYGDPTLLPWVTATEAIAGCSLAGFTWVISHARSAVGRIHSTVTVLACSGMTIAGTITGPLSDPTIHGWVFLGIPLALTWNMRRAVRTGGAADIAQAIRNKWNKGGLREALGFSGSRWTVKKDDEHRTEHTVRVREGQLAEDLVSEVPRIASAVGARRGSMTAVPDEDDPRLLRVTHVKGPSLRKTILSWPGPSNPGADIYASPLIIGMAADWQPSGYCPRDTHILISGTTGAGKSLGGAWNLGAEIISRTKVAFWAADPAKSTQTLGPMLPGLERAATTKQTVKTLIKVIHGIIPGRTQHLAKEGLATWDPKSSLDYIVVLIEEASDAITPEDLKKILTVAKAARSAGIHLILSLQRGTFDQIPTTLRAMLNSYISFGIAREEDIDFALPRRAIDAGADPARWGDRHPGMFYIAAKDTPDDRVAIENRAYLITADQLLEHANNYPARDVDSVTARLAIAAVGEAAWEELNPRSERFAGLNDEDDVDVVGSAPDITATGSVPTTTSTDSEDDKVPTEYDPRQDDDLLEEIGGMPDEAFLFDDKPLPPPEKKISFGPPPTARKVGLEKGREMVRATIDQFGEREFQRHEVIGELAALLDYSPAWYSERLKELVKDGTLVYDDDSQSYRRRLLQPV